MNIVRLSSLRLSYIKNVKNGLIIMPNALRKQLTREKAEVLGIYGQNGSGKTAVIDTLYYLQRIMSGAPLDEELGDYIDADSNRAEITANFNIFIDDIIYEAGYKIELSKIAGKVEIRRETIYCAKVERKTLSTIEFKSAEADKGYKSEDGLRRHKTIMVDYRRLDQDMVFAPGNRFDELAGSYRENKTDLIVARKMAEKLNCSYIFGEHSREIFFREYDNSFRDCSLVMKALFHFALKDLFVIRSGHSAVISTNFMLPMAFRATWDGLGYKGDFVIPLTGPVVISVPMRNLLEHIIRQINLVLTTIIPGMQIDIKDYGPQMTDRGENGSKLELLSVRENIPPLPIRMESEGIIKIISILNVLIQAFADASICLAIDELDSGVFEYMLGELLDVFSKSAKGQLIFTSHNLRPLEMLERDSIMFATANPAKRYIHMKQTKSFYNLRDAYLRGITLGGQQEIIYEETDSLKMARAFRKAGRSISNGTKNKPKL